MLGFEGASTSGNRQLLLYKSIAAKLLASGGPVRNVNKECGVRHRRSKTIKVGQPEALFIFKERVQVI